MSEKNNIPKKIGKGLAHFQNFVDTALTAGFKLLKKAGKKKRAVDDKTIKGKIVHGIQKSANFLGQTGESFFNEYEDIKAENYKKHKKKK